MAEDSRGFLAALERRERAHYTKADDATRMRDQVELTAEKSDSGRDENAGSLDGDVAFDDSDDDEHNNSDKNSNDDDSSSDGFGFMEQEIEEASGELRKRF